MLKKIAALVLLLSLKSAAQQLQFIQADSVFTAADSLFQNFPVGVKLGGISGIDHLNGSFYMVSDRSYGNKAMPDTYMYTLNDAKKITNVSRFFGVSNAESIRIDTVLHRIFYSFETDDSTGIGYISADGLPTEIISYSMKNNPMASPNRGIESLAIDKNHKLWYGFESSETGFISIFNSIDSSQTKIYQYPFDVRSCLSEGQLLNENIGNGLTDMLWKNDALLSMERCFDGKNASVKLFENQIPKEGNVLIKKQIFEFLPNNNYGLNGIALKTDNMEGMTQKDGFLYIISDDNFNPKRQRTLMLKLK